MDYNPEDKNSLSEMRALPPQIYPGPREGFQIKNVFPNQKYEIPGWEWRMCWSIFYQTELTKSQFHSESNIHKA